MDSARAGATKRRRERPARPPLSRQGIVDAALAILREEGLGKVTMRRVAAALDTGQASLYVYVRDTEDLHAQLLDALLATVVAPPPADGAWRDRLTRLLADYLRLLLAHPELARMALSTQPSGPRYLALVEAILALLHEGGIPDRAAAWGVDLLLLFVTASAVEHGAPRPTRKSPAEEVAPALRVATSDPARYPQIARLGDELLSGSGAERFRWGIDVILTGLHGGESP